MVTAELSKSPRSVPAATRRRQLKVVLATRLPAGGTDGDSLTASSPFPALAQVWLEDVTRDVDRSPGTKDTYERQVRGHVLPFFEHFTVRELTAGRIDRRSCLTGLDVVATDVRGAEVNFLPIRVLPMHRYSDVALQLY
jgi:hypothetical protein